jgi:2-polyprenyl-3-methyl-5-hydroxy-6-metoxy-1,4-benzoquinol methylase
MQASKPPGSSETMKHWRSISDEPNSPLVREYQKRELAAATGERFEEAAVFYKHYFEGQSVLDIGMVGHAIENSFKADWRHDNIRKIAARTVGIDIVEKAVLELRQKGYDVRLVDATSEVDIGERFDRVVLGDVIEHVDNPAALLRFSARHLAGNGLIVCTTPNPLYIGNALEIIRNGALIANAEHVSWITPTNAMELAFRAGLSLKHVHHYSGAGNSGFRKAGISILKALGLIKYELFARTYIYVFEKP